MTKKPRELNVHWLGKIPYKDGLDIQERCIEARIKNETPDTLYLLEHEEVITLGLGAKTEHLLLNPEALRKLGIEVFNANRGGDVTYHGPGQLVAYPIIDLNPNQRNVRRYVWQLEEVMLRMAEHYGLVGSRTSGLNGAWIGNKKIGAVGVRIRKWVTMHGFAFNVSTRLDAYDFIVPCGIRNRGITSLQNELNRGIEMENVVRTTADIFAAVFQRQMTWNTPPK